MDEQTLEHYERHPEGRSAASVLELCAEIRRLRVVVESLRADYIQLRDRRGASPSHKLDTW